MYASVLDGLEIYLNIFVYKIKLHNAFLSLIDLLSQFILLL